MILAGEKMLAKDMKGIGLVNHVVPGNRLITEAKRLQTRLQEKDLQQFQRP